MDRETTVTVSGRITCPPDWGMTVTNAPFHRLYIKRGGTAWMADAPGSPHRLLEDGTLYLFPTHSSYQLGHNPADPFQVLWFHVDTGPLLLRDPVALPLAGRTALQAAADLAEALVPYSWQDLDGTKDRLLDNLVGALFDLVGREVPLLPCRDERVSRVLDRLNEFDGCRVTLESLADVAGLEKHYLSRTFHKETGLTLKQYQTHLKMRRAMELLRQDRRVSEVAEALDYMDDKAFSRAFKLATGCPPSDYRKRHLLQP